MKRTLLATLSLIAVLCIAAEYRRPKHEAVVLHIQEYWGNSTNAAGLVTMGYQGYIIINAQVSAGVSPIPTLQYAYDPTNGYYQKGNLTLYAEKLAELLDQGFMLKQVSISGDSYGGNAQFVTLVK